SESQNSILKDRFTDFKNKYFNSSSIILHSRDIRKCDKSFQILFDLKIKENFYNDLNSIINDLSFNIISSAINKEDHIKKYGKQALNPYSISLSFIIERLVLFFENELDAQIFIIVESRGKKEDRDLLEYYNRISDLGTHWVSSEKIKKLIQNFDFSYKKENISGLQLSDVCAYPIARSLIYPNESYIPYDIIKKKIYSRNGKIVGNGLKIFP
ncbi:DUF3800 domain-containing protein, partial [Patescibacteria group bacterium]|nr:DUF3800 domain-containing protein [Patescibacteria group bacterium]